jgi:hypothetical protein
MPRTNWLLVNRLDLAAFFKSRTKAPPNDEEILYAAVTAPQDERLKRVVAYAKNYHFPELPEGQIAEVLSRGDDRFLNIALPHDGEQEYLLDWMFDTLMSWETSNFDVAANRQDAARLADNGEVEATASWIEATDRLLRSHGIPLLVFLAPVGSVDPDYADFWKPWPRAYSWNSYGQKTDPANGASRRLSIVIAQEPAQSLTAPHRPLPRPIRHPWKQQDVTLPLVIPFGMEMFDIVAQCPPQGALAEQNHLGQALLLDRPDPALRVGIQVRAARRQRERFNQA